MKLDLWLKTYNGLLGHPDMLLAAHLLFPKSTASFGGAITQFDLYAHVDHTGPPLPGLEPMLAQFRERLATLPKSWFRRKQRLVEIAYHSKLASARELFENERTPADLSTIRTAYREIANVLAERAAKTVKRSDDFDVEAFAAFLRSRQATLDTIPDAAMLALLEQLRASARARGARDACTTAAPSASSAVAVGDATADTHDDAPHQRTRAGGRRPSIIAINHDDYHARHVGRTADGRQFFLTTPFVPADEAHPGREFIALFVFDSKGKLLDAKIDDLGPRAEVDKEKARRLHAARLDELGRVTFERIEVAPFSLQRFGTRFGLIAREPEHDGDEWVVEVQPGNYMAFFAPWDRGEYDT